MEVSIIILSTLCLFQFVYNVSLTNKYISLKKEKKTIEDEKELMSQILPGDKVTFTMPLTWGDKYKFNVLYEADVVDVSDKGIKVSPYNFSEETRIDAEVKKDKTYKRQILEFMKDKWVEREKVSLIMDNEFIRDRKLSEILK